MAGPHVGFRYAEILYNKLLELSTPQPASNLIEYGYPTDDPNPVNLFIGYVGKTGSSVGLSLSSQGTAMRILNSMRAVTQLKMGGPNTESVYIINYKPTEEQYREYSRGVAATSRKISPSKWDTIIDEISRLKTRVRSLETQVRELKEGAGHNIRGS